MTQPTSPRPNDEGSFVPQIPELTAQDIRDFTALYESQFNKPIDEPTARGMATSLLQFYELISRPLPASIDEKDLERHESQPKSDARPVEPVRKPAKSSLPKIRILSPLGPLVQDIRPTKKPEA